MHLGGWPEFNQPALVQHQHQISNVHAEVTVPGSEGGDPPHRGSDEVHDLFPVQNVKPGRDLVQQEHPRLTDKSPGYRQPLPLTIGEGIRRLPHRGVQPAFTRTDRVSQTNSMNDLPTPLIINVTPQQQVVTHGATEQRTRLLDVTDLTSVLIIIMLTKQHPIHEAGMEAERQRLEKVRAARIARDAAEAEEEAQSRGRRRDESGSADRRMADTQDDDGDDAAQAAEAAE